jgi:hypothetical protein
MHFFNLLNASGHTMPYALPETENLMFLGSKALPVRRANNLAAICDPIV